MMAEDPYGLREITAAAKKDSPDGPEATAEDQVPNSTPSTKSKANFFNRLKKTANTKDKNGALDKPDIKIEVSAFEEGAQQNAGNTGEATNETKATEQPVDLSSPTKTPANTVYEQNQKDKPVLLNSNTSPAPTTKKKSKIEVSVEEELALLREELEVAEMQLESEDNDEMKVEWQNEIVRITGMIAQKEAEIALKAKADQEATQPELTTPINNKEVVLNCSSVSKDATKVTEFSADVSQAQDLSLLTPVRTITQQKGLEESANADEEKRSQNPTAEEEGATKSKKKGKLS